MTVDSAKPVRTPRSGFVSIIAALDQIIEDLSDELGAQTTSAIFSDHHRVSDDEAAADAFVPHSEDAAAEAATRGLSMNHMVLNGFFAAATQRTLERPFIALQWHHGS
jgi:hypothetical protein